MQVNSKKTSTKRPDNSPFVRVYYMLADLGTQNRNRFIISQNEINIFTKKVQNLTTRNQVMSGKEIEQLHPYLTTMT